MSRLVLRDKVWIHAGPEDVSVFGRPTGQRYLERLRELVERGS